MVKIAVFFAITVDCLYSHGNSFVPFYQVSRSQSLGKVL